ncbi:MAG: hypothetical protein HWD61_04960 [Parachlamydiaceae bacterium]|nr:MAG: hypothetical protein HWD61_04960 [Parachlamydiaceae bacterium]
MKAPAKKAQPSMVERLMMKTVLNVATSGKFDFETVNTVSRQQLLDAMGKLVLRQF